MSVSNGSVSGDGSGGAPAKWSSLCGCLQYLPVAAAVAFVCAVALWFMSPVASGCVAILAAVCMGLSYWWTPRRVAWLWVAWNSILSRDGNFRESARNALRLHPPAQWKSGVRIKGA